MSFIHFSLSETMWLQLTHSSSSSSNTSPLFTLLRFSSPSHRLVLSPSHDSFLPTFMASSSRARSSSPFSYRKPSSFSSASSTSSSYVSNKLMPRSCSSSASSYFNTSGGAGYGTRSMTPTRTRSDSVPRAYGARTPVAFGADELVPEPIDAPRSGGDSISVTIRFRPLK